MNVDTTPTHAVDVEPEEEFSEEDYERLQREEVEEAVRRAMAEPICRVQNKFLERLAHVLAEDGSNYQWLSPVDLKYICSGSGIMRPRQFCNAEIQDVVESAFPSKQDHMTIGKYLIIRAPDDGTEKFPDDARFAFLNRENLQPVAV